MVSTNDKKPNPIGAVAWTVFRGALGGLAGAIASFVLYFLWAIFTEFSDSADEHFETGAVIIVVGCVLIGLLIGAVPPILEYRGEVNRFRKRKADEAKRRADAAIAAEQAVRDRQLGYARMLETLNSQAANLFASLPKHLNSAEGNLKRASELFPVPSYGRFWDAMFAARDSLNQFQSSAESIRQKTVEYERYSELYEGTAPPFPVSLDDVAQAVAGNDLYRIFAELYSTADTDKGYSDKLDNREMKQTMEAGFESLERSVNRMGSEISGAVNSLSHSIEGVESSLHSLSKSIDYSSSAAERADGALLETVRSQQAEVAGARRELEQINRRARYGY
ncbi:hypothetical protein [Rhodococcus sp. WB1]|uniref:hypothetical protein n=1 Tax=Rhodococcus sp. WB1 TaxID=1033922 RepID=UPI0012F48850|nr:hypothetical protein [Rhodococcus sp. WB1]